MWALERGITPAESLTVWSAPGQSLTGRAQPRDDTSRGGRAGRVVVAAVVLGALLTYVATFAHRRPGYSFLDDGALDNVVMGLAAVVCLGRAVLVPTRRVAFGLFGVTAASWTAGNMIHVFHDQLLDPVPYPSLADVGYLSAYPLLIAGIVLLVKPELRGISLGSFLDGVVGALSCAAAGSMLTVAPALATLGGSALTQVVGAAYPVLDLALVAMLVGVLTLRTGPPSAMWMCITAGIAAQAVADTVYLHQVAHGSYVVGTPLDALWAVGLACIAVSATCADPPVRPSPKPPPTGWWCRTSSASWRSPFSSTAACRSTDCRCTPSC
jgi:hypothetical protein